MQTIDLGRASRVVLLLCAACKFDTAPSLLPLDGVPADTQVVAGDTSQHGDFGNPQGHPSEPSPQAVTTGSTESDAAPPAHPGASADAAAPALRDAGTDRGDAAIEDAAVEVVDAAAIDGAAPDPTEAEPGTIYAPCADNAGCDTGLVCTSVVGDQHPFCTATCTLDSMGAVTCPQPQTGGVTASCNPSIALCVLSDCEHAECPAGLHCVDTAIETGSGFEYHDYDCQP